jgi:transcriptional regulator with XRE-family HTH domain
MINMDFLAMRKAKGWTQIQAAKECGVSANAWIKWECGGGTPNEESMKRIRSAFSITVKDFAVLRPMEPDEWEDDKDWLAKRLCFLYEVRQFSYGNYPKLQEEIQEMYECFGSDNCIIGKANELFYNGSGKPTFYKR